MQLLPEDFRPTKCPKCGMVCIKYIKEGIPKHLLERYYPDGICRHCKKKILKDLGRLK